MTPDSTDWKIINLLRNAHMTNSAIAAQIGVVEGTVRQRIRKLKESGVLVVRALIDPERLENQQLATIAVTVTESRLLKAKAEEIAALQGVLSVSIVSGRYDLMVEVLVESNKGLVTFLTSVLSTVEGVSATESFIVMKSYKKVV
ncbi:MAG: Lrp/AsnC family transcriptional regulator [Lentisphaerae bacterium]|nr:Lrp/AsnC family transcriptional regulator [Lentisphaerota bacterium]